MDSLLQPVHYLDDPQRAQPVHPVTAVLYALITLSMGIPTSDIFYRRIEELTARSMTLMALVTAETLMQAFGKDIYNRFRDFSIDIEAGEETLRFFPCRKESYLNPGTDHPVVDLLMRNEIYSEHLAPLGIPARAFCLFMLRAVACLIDGATREVLTGIMYTGPSTKVPGSWMASGR